MLSLRRGLAPSRKTGPAAFTKPAFTLRLQPHVPCPDAPRRMVRVHASDKNGAVIDKPSTAPAQGKENEAQKKRPPAYKVLLHNDHHNSREGVVKVLLKVIQGLSIDKAMNVMQEAHETGVAMVVVCAQEVAERYCENLRLHGLTSTIES